jgi:DNA polymerase-3 subunit epsilon
VGDAVSHSGWVGCLDVETTGLSPDDDRVVSFAVVAFDPAQESWSAANVAHAYLIFNPGRRNHTEAARIHGFDDWTLAHQQPFAIYAERLAVFLSRTSLIVGYNVGFDLAFINAELGRCGLPAISTPSFCTMREAEQRTGRHLSLAEACVEYGLSRASDVHIALEDAWLAGGLYQALRGAAAYFPFSTLGRRTPLNWIEPPPAPKKRGACHDRSEIGAALLTAAPAPPDALFRRFSATRGRPFPGAPALARIGLVYLAGSDPTARRIVDVLSIAAEDGSPKAIVGFCHLRNTRRKFRIDRIGGLFDPDTGEPLATACVAPLPPSLR